MATNDPKKGDPAREWVNTLSWPDMVIARCFPRFFRKYAPEELQEQWEAYLEKRQRRKH